MGERLSASFTLLGIWVVVVTVGLTGIVGGYWLSDRVYDAGLWPIGAIMRIALLLALLGVAATAVMLPIGAIIAFFKKGWLEEP